MAVVLKDAPRPASRAPLRSVSSTVDVSGAINRAERVTSRRRTRREETVASQSRIVFRDMPAHGQPPAIEASRNDDGGRDAQSGSAGQGTGKTEIQWNTGAAASESSVRRQRA